MGSMSAEAYTIEPLSAFDLSLAEVLLDLRFVLQGSDFDADVLLDGLCKLIEQKLSMAGAKIGTNDDEAASPYALYSPARFSDVHPPVLFEAYQARDDVDLDDCFAVLPEKDLDDKHPSAYLGHMRCLDRASESITPIKSESARRRQCSRLSFGPIRRSLRDMISLGGPLLTVELVMFPKSNRSMLRVIFPHIVFDAASMASLLQGWSMTLAGKHAEVPEMLSIRSLPAEMQSRTSDQRLPKGLFYFGRLEQLLFRWYSRVRHTLHTFVQHRGMPKKHRRTLVHIPTAFIQRLRERAMLEGSGLVGLDFVSDGDLTSAWLLSRFASERKGWWNGWMSLNFQANLRTIIPSFAAKLGIVPPTKASGSKSKALLAAKSVFLHNAAINVGVFTSSWARVSRMSVSQIAWLTRAKVATLQNDSQISLAHWNATQEVHVAGKAVVPFTWYGQYCISSNWLQANPLGAIQFAPALKKTHSSLDGQAIEVFIPPLEGELYKIPPLFFMDILCRRANDGGILVCTDLDERSVLRGTFGRAVDLGKSDTIDFSS